TRPVLQHHYSLHCSMDHLAYLIFDIVWIAKSWFQLIHIWGASGNVLVCRNASIDTQITQQAHARLVPAHGVYPVLVAVICANCAPVDNGNELNKLISKIPGPIQDLISDPCLLRKDAPAHNCMRGKIPDYDPTITQPNYTNCTIDEQSVLGGKEDRAVTYMNENMCKTFQYTPAVLLVVAHSAYNTQFPSKFLAEGTKDVIADLTKDLHNDPCFNKIYTDVISCFKNKVPNYNPKETDPKYTCCVIWNEIDCIAASAKMPTCLGIEMLALTTIETKLEAALEATGKACEKHKFASDHAKCPME
ncbi:unnamed protein product, partial [Medioppia subpectinata]